MASKSHNFGHPEPSNGSIHVIHDSAKIVRINVSNGTIKWVLKRNLMIPQDCASLAKSDD